MVNLPSPCLITKLILKSIGKEFLAVIIISTFLNNSKLRSILSVLTLQVAVILFFSNKEIFEMPL